MRDTMMFSNPAPHPTAASRRGCSWLDRQPLSGADLRSTSVRICLFTPVTTVTSFHQV